MPPPAGVVLRAIQSPAEVAARHLWEQGSYASLTLRKSPNWSLTKKVANSPAATDAVPVSTLNGPSTEKIASDVHTGTGTS